MRLAAAVAIAVALIAAPAVGRADAQDEARTLLREGNRLLQEGDYVRALDMYRTAYARVPSVKLLLNIGTALRQLGRDAEAADAYEKYLRDPAADQARKAEVQKIIDELDRRVARLRLDTSEPGALVVVDGRWRAGAQMRVDPGTHTIVAEKDGFQPAVSTVTVAAGEQRIVTLHLVSTAPPAAPPPMPEAKPTPPAPEAKVTEIKPTPPAETKPAPQAKVATPAPPTARAAEPLKGPSMADVIAAEDAAAAKKARRNRWIWIGVGGGVVAAGVVALAVGLTLSQPTAPRTDGGVFTPAFK